LTQILTHTHTPKLSKGGKLNKVDESRVQNSFKIRYIYEDLG